MELYKSLTVGQQQRIVDLANLAIRIENQASKLGVDRILSESFHGLGSEILSKLSIHTGFDRHCTNHLPLRDAISLIKEVESYKTGVNIIMDYLKTPPHDILFMIEYEYDRIREWEAKQK